MRRHRFWTETFWLLLLTACAAVTASAAEPPLSVSIVPVARSPRSDAPMWVDVRIDCKTAALMEGVLQIVALDVGRTQWTYSAGPLALTGGVQSFRIMLPPVQQSDPKGWAEVGVRFATAKATYDLGTYPLPGSSFLKRTFVVCVGAPQDAANATAGDFARLLALERFDPTPSASERLFATSTALVSPEDFPASPLGYCAYDLVFLSGGTFGLLREKQLQTLGRWVEAGGSVFIEPSGTLQLYHIEWLKTLRGGDASMALGPHGRLVPAEGGPSADMLQSFYGLGRVVVATQGLPPAESPQWTSTAAFLLKVRYDKAREMAADGKWKLDTGYFDRPTLYAGSRSAYGVYGPSGVAGDLVQDLLPESLRIMPLRVVALILALLVLAVGPIDYVVLGLLKQRRLTWVLFPATCVGVAWFIIHLSGQYVGTMQDCGTCVIADIGEAGRVARWSRYQMAMVGREVDRADELTGSFYAQVDTGGGAHGSGMSYSGGFSVNPSMTDPPSGQAPLYEGRFPASFQVKQHLRQWTPSLSRTFSLDPPHDAGPLKWEAVSSADFQSFVKRAKLAPKLLEGRDFKGWLYLLHGDAMQTLRRGPSDTLAIEDFLHNICAPAAQGPLSVVAQLAPAGGADWSDLALLDRADRRQWLLVAVIPEGNSYTIYRRLFIGE